MKITDSTTRRTYKDGTSEKLMKTPASSGKLVDNSTALGISNMGDVTTNKANSNSPLEKTETSVGNA